MSFTICAVDIGRHQDFSNKIRKSNCNKKHESACRDTGWHTVGLSSVVSVEVVVEF